jgi:hypothetical protein
MPIRPAGRLTDSPTPKGLVGRQDERADLGGAAVERTRAPVHPRKSSRRIDPVENRFDCSAREPFVNRSPNERLGVFFRWQQERCFGPLKLFPKSLWKTSDFHALAGYQLTHKQGTRKRRCPRNGQHNRKWWRWSGRRKPHRRPKRWLNCSTKCSTEKTGDSS